MGRLTLHYGANREMVGLIINPSLRRSSDKKVISEMEMAGMSVFYDIRIDFLPRVSAVREDFHR